MHKTKTAIRREINQRYYANQSALTKFLHETTKSCFQCQYNANTPKPHLLRQTDFVQAPRATWAVDIIPSMTTTPKGNSSIFLAIDMFTGFVQLKALKSRQSSELIEAIKSIIIAPFGPPKIIRSDNESGMANAKDFFTFLEANDIKFLPCSTASPWSNGAAERAVQSIKRALKRFAQQEKITEEWDDYLHYFVNAHNKSTSIYGYPPEQLQFGFANPSVTDLIEIWPKVTTPDEYAEKIFQLADKARNIARKRANDKSKANLTYRNKNRTEKAFFPGQIVLHRQLQVSTGTGGALKPTFTGPYVINSIDKDGCSATIEHLHTKQEMNAHFTNLQIFNFDPHNARLPDDFEDEINHVFKDKYSFAKLYPDARKKRLQYLLDRRRPELSQEEVEDTQEKIRQTERDIERLEQEWTQKQQELQSQMRYTQHSTPSQTPSLEQISSQSSDNREQEQGTSLPHIDPASIYLEDNDPMDLPENDDLDDNFDYDQIWTPDGDTEINVNEEGEPNRELALEDSDNLDNSDGNDNDTELDLQESVNLDMNSQQDPSSNNKTITPDIRQKSFIIPPQKANPARKKHGAQDKTTETTTSPRYNLRSSNRSKQITTTTRTTNKPKRTITKAKQRVSSKPNVTTRSSRTRVSNIVTNETNRSSRYSLRKDPKKTWKYQEYRDNG
jgi:hypothetical protein